MFTSKGPCYSSSFFTILIIASFTVLIFWCLGTCTCAVFQELLLLSINCRWLYQIYLVFPLHTKSDVVPIFLAFLRYVSNTFFSNVVVIQSDWEGEFRPLNSLLKTFGITHRISCPYFHPQNDSVERRHHHIVEMGLSLLAHSFMPTTYWVEAFQTTTLLINCMPTPILKNISPFQALFHHSPDYSFFHFWLRVLAQSKAL